MAKKKKRPASAMALSVSISAATAYISCFSSSNKSTVSSPPLLKNLRFLRFWPWQKVKMGPLSESPTGFGTWAWGNQLLWDYQESMNRELQEVFNNAVENGLIYLMSDDSYETGKLNGQSEKFLGKFIHEFEGNKQVQDNIVIAAKFAAYPWCLTPGQFVNACKSSFDRMQVEQIRRGKLHWSTANYASLQGLVRAVGVSNYWPKQLLKIHDYLRAQEVPLCSAQVAIHWCICKGTIPIPGVESVKQAEENLGALGWQLTSDELLQLENEALESP